MPIEPDRPSASVRTGEELDATTLAAYLTAALPDVHGPLAVTQYPSGYSNLTYLLRMGDRELVLRRPPFGATIPSAHDMGREYRVLSGLAHVYGKVPPALLYCEDTAIIGAPFYVMARVDGIILRPHLAADPTLTPARMTRLSGALVDTLAEIHAVDVDAAGLADLGRPTGYVARQITGWSKRYRKAQTDEIATLDAVMIWLGAHQPGESGRALIHNDYKYDNVVFAPDDMARIVAVLDWEMCTVGDPHMDLGTTLGYWIEPDDPAPMVQMFGLTTLPGNFTRAKWWRGMRRSVGARSRSPVLLRLRRLQDCGHHPANLHALPTRAHPRRALCALIHVVHACGDMAARAIEADAISANRRYDGRIRRSGTSRTVCDNQRRHAGSDAYKLVP